MIPGELSLTGNPERGTQNSRDKAPIAERLVASRILSLGNDLGTLISRQRQTVIFH